MAAGPQPLLWSGSSCQCGRRSAAYGMPEACVVCQVCTLGHTIQVPVGCSGRASPGLTVVGTELVRTTTSLRWRSPVADTAGCLCASGARTDNGLLAGLHSFERKPFCTGDWVPWRRLCTACRHWCMSCRAAMGQNAMLQHMYRPSARTSSRAAEGWGGGGGQMAVLSTEHHMEGAEQPRCKGLGVCLSASGSGVRQERQTNQTAATPSGCSTAVAAVAGAAVASTALKAGKTCSAWCSR